MKIIVIDSKLHGKVKVLVDDEDFERVSKIRWYASKAKDSSRMYIIGSSTGTAMHRFIVDCPKGLVVDHINHNTLDNRKENLRICRISQNSIHRKHSKKFSTKYKGVRFISTRKEYEASINPSGKRIQIGYFDTEEEAALAYNKAAKKHYGSFAYLNDVPSIKKRSKLEGELLDVIHKVKKVEISSIEALELIKIIIKKHKK